MHPIIDHHVMETQNSIKTLSKHITTAVVMLLSCMSAQIGYVVIPYIEQGITSVQVT